MTRPKRNPAKPRQFADMTIREFARHVHERGGKAEFEIKPALVPCYPLRSVLTDEQWAAVAPFVRETFTETWEAIGASFGPDRPEVALALLAATRAYRKTTT